MLAMHTESAITSQLRLKEAKEFTGYVGSKNHDVRMQKHRPCYLDHSDVPDTAVVIVSLDLFV